MGETDGPIVLKGQDKARVVEIELPENELLQQIDRDRLSRAVSGRDWAPQDRTIDVLVRRLRGKIDEGRADSLIVTVRGEGYRLAVDSERRRA